MINFRASSGIKTRLYVVGGLQDTEVPKLSAQWFKEAARRNFVV